MSGMTGVTLMFLVFSATSAVVNANAFLKVHASSRQERMSEEDVQTSLLAEVEGTFGEGSASSRLKQLEAMLATMYKALPKNEQGYLGHATVRYALHRLFVQRHGWVIKGLDTAGGHRNSTTSAGLLKEQVPAYIQDLFEQRLGGRGFGLHELGVLAATIEHLVHSEAIKRLGEAFKVHNHLPTSLMSAAQTDDVLDTYMTAYIIGEDLSNLTLDAALELQAEMPGIYLAWNNTQEFVRSTRRNITESDGSAEQIKSGELDFSIVARIAERVGEHFGNFQDTDCQQIKSSLVKMDVRGTGRVYLSDFYKPALDGVWQFQESAAYLRQIGALDETDPSKPRVVIANYMYSPANCIASSSFYSVCCMDECESLLGHLEQQIAAPEATPARIAALVENLSSSSVAAPRKLSPLLSDKLEEIASGHGGSVQLHGRLFAQWMHHAFPRECPYPHLSGSTSPLTPDEWLESTGEDVTATDKEMLLHVESEANVSTHMHFEAEALPWSPEEELLVHRSSSQQAAGGKSGSALMLVALLVMAYSFARSSNSKQPSKGLLCPEKFLV